jgi:hypothetical protein
MFWAYVPSSETNRRGDGWMLVRTLTCARPGRSVGKVMVANRYLGNPTDRDDNGGLRNRLCYGSRTEAPREIEGIAIGPYRACASQFYPNNLRLLRPEGTDQSPIFETVPSTAGHRFQPTGDAGRALNRLPKTSPRGRAIKERVGGALRASPIRL